MHQCKSYLELIVFMSTVDVQNCVSGYSNSFLYCTFCATGGQRKDRGSRPRSVYLAAKILEYMFGCC